MSTPATRSMFRFTYQKPMAEVIEKMEAKAAFLEAKVTDRQGRVARIREAFDISDADMIDLLTQHANPVTTNAQVKMSYTIETNGGEEGEVRIIAAGVIQNLVTEKSLIEQEQETIKQLKRICRNLKPITHFGENGEAYTQDFVTLSDSELEYLGF